MSLTIPEPLPLSTQESSSSFDNNSNHDDNTPSLTELRHKLHHLRHQRLQVQQVRRHVQQQHVLLTETTWTDLSQQRQHALDEYQSILQAQQGIRCFLQYCEGWNVLNDCFLVWHDGPFATMNGARCGGAVPRLPSDLLMIVNKPEEEEEDWWFKPPLSTSPTSTIQSPYGKVVATTTTGEEGTSATAPTPTRRLWGGWNVHPSTISTGTTTTTTTTTSTNAATNPHNYHSNYHISQHSTTTTTSTTTPLPTNNIHNHNIHNNNIPPPTVPWPEFNAALGDCCLLLQVLLDKGLVTSYPYTLYPRGSHSQIGTPQNQNQRYALWFDPHTLQPYYYLVVVVGFHAKSVAWKSFQQGLDALMECVQQAATQIVVFDKTMQLPHVMVRSSSTTTSSSSGATNSTTTTNGGSTIRQPPHWNIGGISLILPTTAPTTTTTTTTTSSLDTNVTRACHYLLTNLKWLVACAVKHVDV